MERDIEVNQKLQSDGWTVLRYGQKKYATISLQLFPKLRN